MRIEVQLHFENIEEQYHVVPVSTGKVGRDWVL